MLFAVNTSTVPPRPMIHLPVVDFTCPLHRPTHPLRTTTTSEIAQPAAMHPRQTTTTQCNCSPLATADASSRRCNGSKSNKTSSLSCSRRLEASNDDDQRDLYKDEHQQSKATVNWLRSVLQLYLVPWRSQWIMWFLHHTAIDCYVDLFKTLDLTTCDRVCFLFNYVYTNQLVGIDRF